MKTNKYPLFTTGTLTLAACLILGAAARAACMIGSENLPLDTAMTNQYPVATFSVAPQDCW